MNFKDLKNILFKYTKSRVEYARFCGVKVGENCFISIRDWGTEPYLIEIGNNVGITSGCKIHTHGGARVARRIYPKFDVFGKVKICDWAYIGTNSQIMPGVTIGEGSLIAAGSIVTKSVPPNEVWGGQPAKRLCSVDEYIKRNLPFNVDSKGLNQKEKKHFLLSLPEDRFLRK